MINTREALIDLVQKARVAESVALDTEFVWEDTYYPRLGIIQLGWSDTDCFLIDAVAIDDLSPLGDLLSDKQTVKILHDAQQDLWILKHATGMTPSNIFDTRCAGGFAGMSSTLSLSNLLRMCLDAQLPKTETRTDWLRRPLSDDQLDYALDDVRYLPALRDHLLQAIRHREREAWLIDELTLYDDASLYDDRDPDLQYQRVKGTGRLSRHELAVVRELAAWREAEAKTRDVPRSRVLGDDAFIEIARRKPRAIDSFKRLRRVSERDVSRYGEVLLSVVKRGMALDEHDCPQASDNSRPNPVEDARLDLAMAVMRGKSLSDGVDIGLVASRSDVKDLVSNGDAGKHSRLLRGWRYEFLGEDLLALLSGKHAIAVDSETHLPTLICERT
ncbi:MAG: ribonuclease D [Candidatus Latescibacteria bacterium]|nr:ribonuclease D [Candidatus Latescibacterota bacterium]